MMELRLVIEHLRKMDEDYRVVALFLARPDTHFSLVESTIKDKITATFDTKKSINALSARYDEVMNRINDQWWNNTYAVHDIHFHKDFKSYCNCQFTCLTEIIDCLDKIVQGA